jgi:hypothetical protein
MEVDLNTSKIPAHQFSPGGRSEPKIPGVFEGCGDERGPRIRTDFPKFLKFDMCFRISENCFLIFLLWSIHDITDEVSMVVGYLTVFGMFLTCWIKKIESGQIKKM